LQSKNGLAVKGTLGVLEEAAVRGLIDLHIAVNALKTTGIFLADEIVAAALERDRLRRRPIRE
jgi:predicted nucleic acid-binding protein